MSNHSVIQQVTFDTTYQSAKNVARLEQRLQQAIQHKVLNVIDKVLSQKAFHCHLTLPSVNLDIGTIHPDNLENDFCQQVELRLIEILQQALKDRRPTPSLLLEELINIKPNSDFSLTQQQLLQLLCMTHLHEKQDQQRYQWAKQSIRLLVRQSPQTLSQLLLNSRSNLQTYLIRLKNFLGRHHWNSFSVYLFNTLSAENKADLAHAKTLWQYLLTRKNLQSGDFQDAFDTALAVFMLTSDLTQLMTFIRHKVKPQVLVPDEIPLAAELAITSSVQGNLDQAVQSNWFRRFSSAIANDQPKQIAILWDQIHQFPHAELISFIQGIKHQATVIANLIEALSEPQLLALVCGTDNSSRHLIKRIRATAVSKPDVPSISSSAFWKLTLEYRFTDRGSFHNQKTYIAYLVGKMATALNMTYSDLIAQFAEAVEHTMVDGQLMALTKELKQQAVNNNQSQTNTGSQARTANFDDANLAQQFLHSLFLTTENNEDLLLQFEQLKSNRNAAKTMLVRLSEKLRSGELLPLSRNPALLTAILLTSMQQLFGLTEQNARKHIRLLQQKLDANLSAHAGLIALLMKVLCANVRDPVEPILTSSQIVEVKTQSDYLSAATADEKDIIVNLPSLFSNPKARYIVADIFSRANKDAKLALSKWLRQNINDFSALHTLVTQLNQNELTDLAQAINVYLYESIYQRVNRVFEDLSFYLQTGKGLEPQRWAFMLNELVNYPQSDDSHRLKRLYAQFGEALTRQSAPLSTFILRLCKQTGFTISDIMLDQTIGRFRPTVSQILKQYLNYASARLRISANLSNSQLLSLTALFFQPQQLHNDSCLPGVSTWQLLHLLGSASEIKTQVWSDILAEIIAASSYTQWSSWLGNYIHALPDKERNHWLTSGGTKPPITKVKQQQQTSLDETFPDIDKKLSLFEQLSSKLQHSSLNLAQMAGKENAELLLLLREWLETPTNCGQLSQKLDLSDCLNMLRHYRADRVSSTLQCLSVLSAFIAQHFKFTEQQLASLKIHTLMDFYIVQGKRYRLDTFLTAYLHVIRFRFPSVFADLVEVYNDLCDLLISQADLANKEELSAAISALHQSIPQQTGQSKKRSDTIEQSEIDNPPSGSPEEDETMQHVEIDTAFVNDAGLIILSPYLPALFSQLGLVIDGEFIHQQARERAVNILQHVVGTIPYEEPDLALNKLLCGLEITTAIEINFAISEEEQAVINSLLNAVIKQWNVLGTTSIAGMQESFLQRNGTLVNKDEFWQLHVENRAFDMLLDQLPWSISMTKYSWMTKGIELHWRNN